MNLAVFCRDSPPGDLVQSARQHCKAVLCPNHMLSIHISANESAWASPWYLRARKSALPAIGADSVHTVPSAECYQHIYTVLARLCRISTPQLAAVQLSGVESHSA